MSVAAPPMPTAAPPAVAVPPGYVPPTPYLLDADQFRAALKAGVFGSDKVELLEGMVVKKMTIEEPHGMVTTFLTYALIRLAPAGWLVRTQLPIAPSPNSRPEPDVCVVRGHFRTFLNNARPPVPAEIGLLVEVADSSLSDDRNVKARVYARANIPEYWIVNITDRLVEVYTDPAPNAPIPAYRNRRDFAPGDEVPVRLDGVEVGVIPAADILP